MHRHRPMFCFSKAIYGFWKRGEDIPCNKKSEENDKELLPILYCVHYKLSLEQLKGKKILGW